MIWRYDGTFTGLLSLLARIDPALPPAAVQRPPYPQEDLFEASQLLATDPAAAMQLGRRIARDISPRALHNVRLAFFSERPGIELTLWRYLCLGWQVGAQLDSFLGNPEVHTVHCWARRTAREGHRLKGLARFRELADGILYAPLCSDTNVIPLLAAHFASRLDRPWVLHDLGRTFGAIGNGEQVWLGHLDLPQEPGLSGMEGAWQALWRSFHRQIAIPERINRRRQQQFMPLKYWDYLVEVGPGKEAAIAG